MEEEREMEYGTGTQKGTMVDEERAKPAVAQRYAGREQT